MHTDHAIFLDHLAAGGFAASTARLYVLCVRILERELGKRALDATPRKRLFLPIRLVA